MAEYLALEASASSAHAAFVYDSAAEAAVVRTLLFQRGIAEFSPPGSVAFLSGGRTIGMISVLSAVELPRRRLAAAVAIAREFAGSPHYLTTMDRLRLAGETLTKVKGDDAYLARLAVSKDVVGQGLGRRLIYEALSLARKLGARRCVLDVSSDNVRAIRLYERSGFNEVGRVGVTDSVTGRVLEHIHLAILLEPSET